MLNKEINDKVKAMILVGEAREIMAEAFGALTRVEMADDMTEAVRKAGKLAGAGDTVLLSPACASFDMYNSYAHRGEEFQKALSMLAIHAGPWMSDQRSKCECL